MAIQPVNFINTTLRAPISASDVQLALAAGAGAQLAAITAGNYDYIIVTDGTSAEIMKYVSSGTPVNDTISVLRAQDNTTAKAFPAGACVKIGWNVQQVADFIALTVGNTPSAANTIGVSGTTVPNAPPPTGIIYVVNVSTNTMWYWNGSSWIYITSNNILVVTLHVGVDPMPTPTFGVIWMIVTDTASNNTLLYYWTGTTWRLISALNDTVATGDPLIDPGSAPATGIRYLINTATGRYFYWTGVAWVPVAEQYTEILSREYISSPSNFPSGFLIDPDTDNIFGDMIAPYDGSIHPPPTSDWVGRDFDTAVETNHYQSNTGLTFILAETVPGDPPITGKSLTVSQDSIIEITASAYGDITDPTKPFRARLVIFHEDDTFQYATDVYVPADNGTPNAGMTVSTGPIRVSDTDIFDVNLIITDDDSTPGTYSGYTLLQFCVCATVISRRNV